MLIIIGTLDRYKIVVFHVKIEGILTNTHGQKCQSILYKILKQFN